MLVIQVPTSDELFDESTGRFITGPTVSLRLEHSLFTVSKWEEKWKTPFLSRSKKTTDQIIDYIRCMAVDGIDDETLNHLTEKNLESIYSYIEDPATATTIREYGSHGRGGSSVTTSEVLYFQMFSRQIPMECEHWHLNRLITLIRVWDAYNGPQKKMSKRQTARMYADLNASRRHQSGSKG